MLGRVRRASRRRCSRRRPRRAPAAGRSRCTSSATGTAERRASVFSAGPRPPSARIAGWMPSAISRSSSCTSASPWTIRDSSPSSWWSSGGTAVWAARSSSPSETSRCWAPSWRSRSICRRASSAAATTRVRDAARSAASRVRSSTRIPTAPPTTTNATSATRSTGRSIGRRAERAREDDHSRREADDDGDERRPHAADPRHDHDHDQQAEEHAAEAEVRAERQQRERDQHRGDDGEHQRERAASAGVAPPGARGPTRRSTPPRRRRSVRDGAAGRGAEPAPQSAHRRRR